MSRQRRALCSDTRRLRKDEPLFQASESEILSDLKRLKYVKKPDPIPVEVIVKIDLPKKRKLPEEDDKFVIDGLIKLMSTKIAEPKKKQIEIAPKKHEVTQKPTQPNNAWLAAYAMQAQFMKTMMFYSQFGITGPQFPINTGSTSDIHLRAAKYIQLHKNTAKK